MPRDERFRRIWTYAFVCEGGARSCIRRRLCLRHDEGFIMTPELIFVIDSDEISRDSTEKVLERMGYRASSFASAEEFLLREPLDRAGCIVSDLRLPGMDGLDLFATLHSR